MVVALDVTGSEIYKEFIPKFFCNSLKMEGNHYRRVEKMKKIVINFIIKSKCIISIGERWNNSLIV